MSYVMSGLHLSDLNKETTTYLLTYLCNNFTSKRFNTAIQLMSLLL